MKVVDFNHVEESGLFYGGQSGLKLGIIYNNENWLLKFSKNIRDFKRVDLSYMTSALSEYIGSHVFECLDIPVHETLLGIRDGKLVVACKDFTNDTSQLIEYREIKNYYNQELEEELDQMISNTEDHGSNLKAILIHAEYNPIFKKVNDLESHFWEQSVIDILINNNDRNSGNWGILFDKNKKMYQVSPVFDNGGSFYNKKSGKSFTKYLSNPDLLNTVSTSLQTAYKIDGHNLSIKKFVEIDNEKMKDAFFKIVPLINQRFQDIKDMIQEIPESYQGIHIIDQPTKDFYIKSMEIRYQEILIPRFLEICQERELDASKLLGDGYFYQHQMTLSQRIDSIMRDVDFYEYQDQEIYEGYNLECIEKDLAEGGKRTIQYLEELLNDDALSEEQEEEARDILEQLKEKEKER